MALCALIQQFQKNFPVDDNWLVTWNWNCAGSGWQLVLAAGVVVQKGWQTGFQCQGNPFNIVQAYVVFSTLDSADIAAIKPAEFGQNFLGPAAIGAQQAYLPRQMLPCIYFHG